MISGFDNLKMASIRSFTVVQILISLFSISFGTNVPALIWSPNRPLSDLPDIFAGHSVSTSDFQNKYLKPLASEDVSALVIFVQDRLSVDDFANYADVYNPDSTGGAFHNIKEFMDEHFSVHLPNVKSPLEALEKLRKTYQGKVHELEAPYGVDQLSLHQDGSNLVVVHLPKTRVDEPEKSIAENDKLIATVLSGLSKRKVKYTAIYTAKTTSQDPEDTLKYTGRHLLQNVETPINASIFVNTSCILLYARAISVVVTEKNIPTAYKLTYNDDVKDNCNDNSTNTTSKTLEIRLKPVNLTTASNLTLKLEFDIKPLTQNNDWYIANAFLIHDGKFGNTSAADNPEVKFDLQKIWAPRGLSYHCGFPDPVLEMNATEHSKEGSAIVSLRFEKLQVQAFGVKKPRFGLAWDCVGFFTIPIWMALFSSFILLLVLAYGLYSIMDIKVMDRFDDPKGKTITINAQE